MALLEEGSQRLLAFVAKARTAGPQPPGKKKPLRGKTTTMAQSGRRDRRIQQQKTSSANRAVRAFQQQGYTVVPINPHEVEVEGLKAYGSVMGRGRARIDMASFYLPPESRTSGDRRGRAEKVFPKCG